MHYERVGGGNRRIVLISFFLTLSVVLSIIVVSVLKSQTAPHAVTKLSADDNSCSVLTAEEWQTYLNFLESSDLNGDGANSLDEVNQSLVESVPDTDEIEEWFLKRDLNGDGLIETSEYCNAEQIEYAETYYYCSRI